MTIGNMYYPRRRRSAIALVIAIGSMMQQQNAVASPSATIIPSTSFLRGSLAYSKDASLPSNPIYIIAGEEFTFQGDPANLQQWDDNHVTMTITPWSQAITLQSTNQYDNGMFEFKLKSASVMPGVITAVYLSSGEGRTADKSKSDQDEIDLEFKGKDPMLVQSNLFLDGQGNVKNIDLGYDSSEGEHTYAFRWNQTVVSYYVDGQVKRSSKLSRPLRPMSVHLSCWTTASTAGGWPGLIGWAGRTDWKARSNQSIEATVELGIFPALHNETMAIMDQQQPPLSSLSPSELPTNDTAASANSTATTTTIDDGNDATATIAAPATPVNGTNPIPSLPLPTTSPSLLPAVNVTKPDSPLLPPPAVNVTKPIPSPSVPTTTPPSLPPAVNVTMPIPILLPPTSPPAPATDSPSLPPAVNVNKPIPPLLRPPSPPAPTTDFPSLPVAVKVTKAIPPVLPTTAAPTPAVPISPS